eukprot:3655500-Pleurochrysis_carterae.AAC.1
MLTPAASFISIFVFVMASAVVTYDAARASADSITAAMLISAATAHACVLRFTSCPLMHHTNLLCSTARLARTCVMQASRHRAPEDRRRPSLTHSCVTTRLNAAYDTAARCALHAITT